MIAQGGFARGLGAVITVEAEEFLVGVRQQPAEHLRGGELGVKVGRLRSHAQCVMITANLHAFATAFAEVAHKDGEQAAVARVLLLHTAPNSSDVVVCQRQLIDDGQEFAASRLVDSRQLIHLGPQNILKRFPGFGRHALVHLRAATLVQSGHLIQQRLGRFLIANVIANGRHQNGADILRGIRQGSVRTGRDALHTLRAVFGDVYGCLAPGHVFTLCSTSSRAHYCQAGKGPSRLMVAEVIAELGIKFLHGLKGRPRLALRHGARWATARATTSRSGNLYLAGSLGRQQRITHA